MCPQCQSPCEETHKFCPSCGFPVAKVAQNTDDPLIGRTLPGGYVILELVGVGGMGRVYRAEQTNLGRTVAVKIIHPHLVGDESASVRFITEARAASRLNHPNSVARHRLRQDRGRPALPRHGVPARQGPRARRYEEGPLSFRRIVDILRQVLAALAEAHHLDIIHRDLKPENIILEPMRTGGDFVKVVDFGLAKMRRGHAAQHHEPRHRLRHARLHEPRAGPRRSARRAQRPLRRRRHPLPAPHRPAPVRGRHPDAGRAHAPHRAAAGSAQRRARARRSPRSSPTSA